MLAISVIGCGVFLLTGWFVSHLVPSVAHAPRPVAAAVTTLASLGVLVFTLSGVVVIARGVLIGDFSVVALVPALVLGAIPAGLLVGLAVLIAVSARRDG